MENQSTPSTVEKIIEICKERQIKISKLERDLGYGNGFLNPKKITDVKAARLFEILDYLGMTLEEFQEKMKNPTAESDGKDDYKLDLSGATDKQKELIQRILSYSDDQVSAFLSITQSPTTNR